MGSMADKSTVSKKVLFHSEKSEVMGQNFSCRSYQPEMMDADDVGFEDFQNCLRGLEIVNICALAYRPTLNWLRKALKGVNSRQPISILDVGMGSAAPTRGPPDGH
jgi:hypothetical protein